MGWLGGSGGTGYGADGRVEFFADLPAAASFTDQIYLVEKPSGVIFINRKKAGLYRSDGVNWLYMPNKVQADFVLYDNSTSGLTATELQAGLTEVEFNRRNITHGVLTYPTITDNADGTVDIGTTGLINYFNTADGITGKIIQLSATTGATSFALPYSVNYLYSDYNSGSPIYGVTNNPFIYLADFRLVPTWRIAKDGNKLRIIDYGQTGVSLAEDLFFKDVVNNGFQRITGLTLSTAATRISTVAAGLASFAANYLNLPENKAGVSGDLDQYYLVAGVWNSTIVTEYDSIYYCDGTNRQTLGVAKFVAKYFYRSVNGNHVYYIHGNQQNTAADALNESTPTAPPFVTSHAIYVGKIVIAQAATDGTAYPEWS